MEMKPASAHSDREVTSTKLSRRVPKWRNVHELLMLQLLFHLDKPFNSSEMLHKCLRASACSDACAVTHAWIWPIVCETGLLACSPCTVYGFLLCVQLLVHRCKSGWLWCSKSPKGLSACVFVYVYPEGECFPTVSSLHAGFSSPRLWRGICSYGRWISENL